MKDILVMAVTLMVLSLSGCGGSKDIRISTDRPRHIDISRYKTYTILPSSGVLKRFSDRRIQTFDVGREIERTIEVILAHKGKKRVNGHPDFIVAYAAGIDRHAVSVDLDRQSGKGVIVPTPKAQIVLVLADAKTGRVLWSASAEGDVKHISEPQRKERIEAAVAAMLQKL